MKVLWFSLVLLLVLACGEALKCNRCVPYRPGGSCTTTVEECGYNMDACVSAHFTISPYGYFRRCIKMSDCLVLQGSPLINARCCKNDHCN